MIGCNATVILILGQLEKLDVRPTSMFGVELNNLLPQKVFYIL